MSEIEENKIIKITCKSKDYMDLDNFKNFQADNFKELTKLEKDKLKTSILDMGFFLPILFGMETVAKKYSMDITGLES